MPKIVFSFLILSFFYFNSAVFPSRQEIKLNELPLIIKPAVKTIRGPVFYLISGDGGWNNFDNSFCEGLAKNGIPVIGLDSKKYFWSIKTPEETARVFEKLIETYNKKFERDSFVIAGYSFGADIVPFVTSRFSPDTRKRLTKIILMSPDRYGDFEIHLSDMLNMGIARRKYNVMEEVKKINFSTVTCIFGKNEEAVNLNSFKATGSTIIILPGDHHYNNNYQLLDDTLLKIILHSSM